MQDKSAKRTWEDPQLFVFGTVGVWTLARNKDYGSGDAFTFQSQSTQLSH
jgi:hypothetical protein